MDNYLRNFYEKEINRLRTDNLRVKLHMEIIVNTPMCRTARFLMEKYRDEASMNETDTEYSALNMN